MTGPVYESDHTSVLAAGRKVTQFADQVFTHLPRADQRRWAAAYLLGLLAVSGRKSVRSLAAAVTDSPTASQSMHRFVNASPWEWQPARAELTRWTERRLRPTAWTVGTAVVPKRGNQSCGVHRRFDPVAGRSVNCQVATGLFLAAGRVQIPVDWRLHLPGEWSDERLRRRARIPESVQPVPEWVHILDLADTLAPSLPTPLPLVADLRAYEQPDRLLHGLRQRGHDFVVTVPDTLPVVLPLVNQGARGIDAAPLVSARRFLDAHGEVLRTVLASPHGGAAGAKRIVTAVASLPRGPRAQRFCRLFAEYRADGRGAPSLWMTTLVHRPVEELMELAGAHAWTPGALRRMEGSFGLQDFEGRSFPGWHRNVTLVSAACAYSRLAEAEPAPKASAGPNAAWLHDGPLAPPPRLPQPARAGALSAPGRRS
ncbi:transposase [Streptomyces sp. NBC_01102]|uniref:IS701 family transposase n=1 Tax=unclassified Streptomyces TaxID=2593676 RepID=UPI003862DB75|nr:transposase [Streptomyces sp. NBC_01102]